MNLNSGSVFRRFVLPCGLVGLFLLFFFGGPAYHSPRSFKTAWNLGHIIFFASLPYYLFSGTNFGKKNGSGFFVQIIIVVGIALLLGSLIELIQGSIQQDREYGDIFRDVIGGLVAMFFLLPVRKTIAVKFLRLMQVLTTCLVVSQLYPVIAALSDEWVARDQFPVLSDFETPFEIERWNGSAGRTISNDVAISGKHSMRMQLGTGKYSGVSLKYFPGDWKGFRAFEFSVYNPDQEEIKITCRINDRKHVEGEKELFSDRFNRTFVLVQGWHTIRISAEDILRAPAERKMDVVNILGVGIFAVRLPRARVIYIDGVRVCY